MNLGEILDRTFQIYRSKFLVFLEISAAPAAVVLGTAYGLPYLFARLGSSRGAPWPPWEGILAGLLQVLAVLAAIPVLLGATALAMAAMSHAAARAYLGEKVTFRGAYNAVWRRGWRYAWLMTLQGLILLVVPDAAWIVLLFIFAFARALLKTAGMTSADTILVVIIVLAFLALFVWMLSRLSLAFPACVIEEIGAWAALKRSSSLSKGTGGFYILAAVLAWMLSIGITLTLGIIMALIPGLRGPQHAPAFHLVMGIASRAVGFAVLALILPVYGIALTLLYYDQRIRLEGFDIEWMMQQAGLVAPPPPEPPPSENAA
jgi:hypothetical protein